MHHRMPLSHPRFPAKEGNYRPSINRYDAFFGKAEYGFVGVVNLNMVTQVKGNVNGFLRYGTDGNEMMFGYSSVSAYFQHLKRGAHCFHFFFSRAGPTISMVDCQALLCICFFLLLL